MITTTDGTISVAAGEPCEEMVMPDESPEVDKEVEEPEDSVQISKTAEGDEVAKSSAVKNFLGLSVPLLFGRSMGISGGVGSALITTLALTSSSATPWAHAQDLGVESECEIVPIEVDIYVDTTADEIVMMEAQSGDFEVCPPESKYPYEKSCFHSYDLDSNPGFSQNICNLNVATVSSLLEAPPQSFWRIRRLCWRKRLLPLCPRLSRY